MKGKREQKNHASNVNDTLNKLQIPIKIDDIIQGKPRRNSIRDISVIYYDYSKTL